MRSIRLSVIAAILACSISLVAESASMLGDWKEPTGSVIRIESCASGLCLRIVSLSPTAPARLDVNNPDSSLRARLLCNLVIGTRFQITDASHAGGGSLYDPKSGNTYRGGIILEGDTLKLRGYIGLPLFGRTEIWHRNTSEIPPCNGSKAR